MQGQLLRIPILSNSTGNETTLLSVTVFNVTNGTYGGTNSFGKKWYYTGGGIWSTPTIDPLNNIVWVTTGNEEDNATHKYWFARSIIGLNATTLHPLYAKQFAHGGTADQDFGAGATLFTNSSSHTAMVAAINKDGIVYSMTQTGNVTGWTASLSPLGDGWSIAPAAYQGRNIIPCRGTR